MRIVCAICPLLIAFSPVRGQDQERKLLDRLLRPDTTLQNSGQNKKFTADRTLLHKRAAVGTFYFEQKPVGKSYPEQPVYSAGQFNSRSFDGEKRDVIGSQKQISTLPADSSTRTQTTVRSANDSEKLIAGKDYSGNRPFLGQGKNQKALSQQKPSLTVDEVRELLNKNK